MLVLASKSPRRQEILRHAGIPFVVRPVMVHEERKAGERPEQYVLRLAGEKAAAASASPEEVVLGADTIVVVDDAVLEKPVDDEDAANMLRRLSGREHQVLTGICLRSHGKEVADLCRTSVWFSTLTEQEILDYVASGEPRDKAGAYAIQGLAAKFVEKIDGCYWNVVGLPVSLVYRHWKELLVPCK